MDVLKDYRIYRLITREAQEDDRPMLFRLGKRYANAGICVLIEFDWEEFKNSKDKIFHIWCKDDSGETRCWGSLVNLKCSIQYDTKLEENYS